MLSRTGSGNRLLRHDRLIAVNYLRANFARWSDRLMGAGMLVAALAVVHGWSTDQAWETAAWAAAAAGVAAGIGTGHLLAARIAFHRFDGVLAAVALQPANARGFRLAWHIAVLAGLAAITLVARPALIMVSVPAYVVGAALAELTSRLALPRTAIGLAMHRSLRARLHQPLAGLAAATVLLLSLAPAQVLSANARMGVIGIEAILFAIALTPVDHHIIRYRTSIGHRPAQILLGHAAALLTFGGTAAVGCWLIVGPVPAGIVIAASAATLYLLALRVLAYAAHRKRVADVLVSILAGLLALVGYAMMFLLPVVAGVLLWQLHRRAAARTWLLA